MIRPLPALTFSALALLAACGDGEDTGPADDGYSYGDEWDDLDENTDEDYGCDEVTVWYDGADEPVVGDLWTVWPKCDGATVIGSTVIRVDPVECAQIYENEITFALAGTCTISVQVGNQYGYLDVEVGEAR
jgi:hypothetical protein